MGTWAYTVLLLNNELPMKGHSSVQSGELLFSVTLIKAITRREYVTANAPPCEAAFLLLNSVTHNFVPKLDIFEYFHSSTVLIVYYYCKYLYAASCQFWGES